MKVKDGQGRPVANARVWVAAATGMTADIAALSDQAGGVTISVPSSGPCAIGCSASGFTNVLEELNRYDGAETLTVTLRRDSPEPS